MKLISRIKKILEGPILYDEYMNNPDLKISDLNENEYKDIKLKLNSLLDYYGIIVSESDKLEHLCKKINLFERFYPYNSKIAYKQGMNYHEFMSKCLEYHFQHLEEGTNFNFFEAYIRNYLIHDKVSDRQINRYLSGKIKLSEIKTYWEELEELKIKYPEDIFNYEIGHDSCGNPIYDETLFLK